MTGIPGWIQPGGLGRALDNQSHRILMESNGTQLSVAADAAKQGPVGKVSRLFPGLECPDRASC
jgi:hypothetical protein